MGRLNKLGGKKKKKKRGGGLNNRDRGRGRGGEGGGGGSLVMFTILEGLMLDAVCNPVFRCRNNVLNLHNLLLYMDR